MRKVFASVALVVLLCCSFAALADGPTIPDAKRLANDQSVTLTAKTVTYASPDFFYIEEDSRCMGIRVDKTAHGLAVGMKADVTGAMKTNINRERYILASTAVQTAPPNDSGTIIPVSMNNNALGGGDWSVSGTGGQRGITGSDAVNNIGLLVKTWGRFQMIDATTFALDSGEGLDIRCTVPAGTFLNAGWEYAVVTGVSSIYKFNSVIYPPSLLVSDIQVLQPVEVVSVPGTPSGNTSPAVNVSETYATSGSACNQGHQVEYRFNWGDGMTSTWSTSTSASHAWSALGTKTVTVTARCQVHTSISATSAGLQVNVTDSGEMISIPAGDFQMGNNGSEPYSYCSELPQHWVNLSGYSIGKYEVTRGEYQQFMSAGGYSNSAYWSSAGWSWRLTASSSYPSVGPPRTQPSYWAAQQDWGTGTFTQTDNHPVVGVSYYEAEAFCAWAGGHLPTEAQWEKAARWTGSYPNVYPWGNTWDAEKCNNYYDHNSAGGGYQKYQTAPVGSYPGGASPYGCQDMAGNVWEWVQDWYVTYPGSTCPADYTGSSRVLRGGSWSYDDYYYRCAYRNHYNPYNYNLYYGFRLAR